VRAFPGLELRFVRGTGPEISEFLKKGDIEVALAGSLGETWDRLESWDLFTEPYRLVVGSDHPLAGAAAVRAADLAKERLVGRAHCEHLAEVTAFVVESGMRPGSHQAFSEPDVAALLQSNIGFGIMPQSSACRLGVRSLDLEGFDVSRTVCVYGVSGRQRSMAASTFIKMLRAADWSTIEPQSPAGISKVA
jgi:DNA-binding transcriptional LysR family regulator